MSGSLHLWKNISQSKTLCFNIVRHASKRTAKRVPTFSAYVSRESELLFGPARKSDGTPKQQTIQEKESFRDNSTSGNGVIHNAQIKSSVDSILRQTDVATAQVRDSPSAKRPSVVRELDAILTFPLGKINHEKEKQLIPNAQGDIPILISDHVMSLEKKLSMPSVSKILEKSRPPEEQAMLDRWKQKMISELGEDGFALWQKETFARGHNLHSCIQKQLETGDGETNLVEKNAPFWQSVQHVFGEVSDVHLVEKYCKHPHLRYHGYFDCVARFRDKLCLIEWKTSKRQKATIDSTFDNPLQVAAYIGAVNFDQQYDLNIDDGLIVIAYENGQPADVHPMKSNQSHHYWGSWLHRLYTYWRLTLQEQEDLKRSAVTP